MKRAAGSPAPGSEPVPVVTREIAAEAAVWVARLHGPGRTRAMERDCLAWQARSPAHRHAFERCTETWLDVPGVTVAGAFAAAGRRAAPEGSAGSEAEGSVGGQGGGSAADDSGPATCRRALLALAVAGLAVVLWWQPWQGRVDYRTGVGELLAVALDDGSRVSLNTDTRLQVRYTRAQRDIRVLQGEALFEVAHDAGRPFVVQAAGSEVRALGTVFSVRLTEQAGASEQALAVTLMEGKVSVRAAAEGSAGGLAPAQPVLMSPGERVRLVGPRDGAAVASPQLDRPALEQVTAWKRSEAFFDNTALAEAVAEMNRYSRTPIVLADDLAGADWRISGQYRAGDNAGFARAVAAVHGLALRETPGRLVLARGP